MFIYPYKVASESAKSLATTLGAKRIKHEGSRFKGNANKTVINWGSTTLPPEVLKCNVINTVAATSLCVNKLHFFESVGDQFRIPDFTSDRSVAEGWINDGKVVFCRTKLRASSGDGIYEADSPETLRNAPLYTKYIPKKEEYRVHICKGEVFLVQRKALREGAGEGANWHIRNHANGFIFARNEGHTPHDDVITQALAAFNSIEGLTFGSVDVIFNKYRQKAYVLEINTASGLEGETLNDYARVLGDL